MKLRLIFATVLAFGSIAHAQGFVSNLSFSAGLQGVFPSSTFTKDTAENSNGINANTQSTTKSVGAMGSVRYDFGRHSALDLAVTVNRNSELFEYGVNQAFSRVQTNNAEIIGTYIARLPSNEHLKPFFLIGGGMVRFSPNTAFTSGLTPQVDSKPAFAYGFGTDLKFSDSWAIRLQYRGLVRGEPDFKLFTAASPFGTDLKTHVVEPSIQVVYHF